MLVSRTDTILVFASMSHTAAFELAGVKNSLFTTALLDCIRLHGTEEVSSLIKNHVHPAVKSLCETEHGVDQVPWTTSSIGPTPRRFVQLGSTLPVRFRPSCDLRATLGSVVSPLLKEFKEKVCARALFC